MKTAGIIAEYNPFHNGHQFHIEETRRRTGADYVIVVMSGDFVQRGAPAILNKYDRADMALCHGADLVVELPVTAALSSAEGFAMGGISLLDRLGVVDVVSCGCENADADSGLFEKVTALLADEPEEYRHLLASYTREGFTFPKAREMAAEQYLRNEIGGAETESTSSVRQLLSGPNNILALEYAKAIRKRNSSLALCMIPRQGSAYHDANLSDGYCSATAIRHYLFSDSICNTSRTRILPSTDIFELPLSTRQDKTEEKFTSCAPNYMTDDQLAHCTPTDIANVLQHAASNRRCLCENDFSDLLFYALTEKKERLSCFGPDNSGLAFRTENLLENFESWTSFAALLKTKNQTYTAVSRYLAQVLLDITKEDLQLSASCSHAPFVRVLGFRREAAPLLKAMQSQADIPILTQLAKNGEKLNAGQNRLLDLTLRSSEIYKRILFTCSGSRLKSEYRQPMLVY
ncbi:MAG: nucleotidyltransferase family protein [Clostridiales bacterium]|nr:nucleotidyltransferase family protein [Clostridiales bacterium]